MTMSLPQRPRVTKPKTSRTTLIMKLSRKQQVRRPEGSRMTLILRSQLLRQRVRSPGERMMTQIQRRRLNRQTVRRQNGNRKKAKLRLLQRRVGQKKTRTQRKHTEYKVGRVLKSEPMKKKASFKVEIDIDDLDPATVVTSSANVRQGNLVIIALEGATVAGKKVSRQKVGGD